MSDGDDEVDDVEGSMGPEAQFLMTGTWLTVKELSVVLGTVAKCLPVEGMSISLCLTTRLQRQQMWELRMILCF